MAAIGTVDVAPIGLAAAEPDEEALLEVGRRLVAAFEATGFAYVSGHGLPKTLEEETFAAAKRFFALDAQTKMTHERFKTGYNGFTPIGGEVTAYAGTDPAEAGAVDYKECFDLHVRGEGYPGGAAAGIGEQLEAAGEACCALAVRLLAALDAALGAGHTLVSAHRHMLSEGGCTELRVLHYPPVPDSVPAGTVRCAAHTDYGTLTLLLQDSEGGLEVETAPGVWTPAARRPGALLVNVGDMAEVWTSGRLRATNHRVRIPEGARRGRARYSLACFVQPDDGAMVAPLDGDPRYHAVDAGEFLRKQFTATYPAFAGFANK